MIELSSEEFRKFLDTDEVTFTLAFGGGSFEVSPAYTISFDEDMTDAELKHTGYEIIRYKGADEEFHEVFEDYDKAAEYIKQFVPLSDTVVAEKINGFTTLDEFYADRKFMNASMEELLEKYRDCDEFSLTCSTGESIPIAEADRIAEKERKSSEREAEELYEANDVSGLPPFGVLIKDIREECAEFAVKKRKKFPEKRYGKYIASFICDYEADEKTKYYGADFLWHLYSIFGREYDNIAFAYDRTESGDPGADEFSGSGCEFLRDMILREETSFENHCTQTSELLKTYYFPLNDKTREWLASKKNDYDFDVGSLCDLAFYKDGKLRFSSCTHEGFHNDIKDRK